MAKTVKVTDVIFDASIYPRDKPNTSTINQYVDVLLAGESFPPIVLESGTNVLFDGYHRWKAVIRYLELWKETPAKEREGWAKAVGTIEVEFKKCPADIPRMLFCAKLSSRHGDRLAVAEKRKLSRDIIKENPEFSQQTIADYLGVSQSSVHGYVHDILAAKREEQKHVIMRLDRLGWTQSEIAEKIGLTQRRAGQILEELSDLIKLLKTDIKQGFTPEQVAKRKGISHQLAYAIALEKAKDPERLEALDIKIQSYDVWNFQTCHDLFGDDYPGRIPGQLVAHILYFYTKPGDYVIDPMSGSGTTQDVCLAMGRKCYAFDIANRFERPDVIEHNITDGWHERTKKASLIFWDPPYFNKMDDQNMNDGYGKASISKLARKEYLDVFSKAAACAYKMVKTGTRFALLMSDWNDKDRMKPGIFIWDYVERFVKHKWKVERHIQCPLTTQQIHPDIVNRFREQKKLARLGRSLVIFRK